MNEHTPISPSSDLLPAGWVVTTLNELAQPYVEKTHPSLTPEAHYVGLEHVESGGSRRLLGRGRASDITSTKSVFKRGDILFGKLRPYLRKVAIPDFDGICSTDFLVLRATPAIDSAFLSRLLASIEFANFTAAKSGGVNLPRIKWAQLVDYSVSLPPLAEQRRIVERLNELEKRNHGVRATLNQIPSRLTETWQSLLRSAFNGDLTAKWRAATNETFTKKGIDVLNHALELRKSKTQPEEHIKAGEHPVPETWCWASLDAITATITSGSRDWSKYYRDDGYGVFLLAQNIRPMRLDLSSIQKVSPPEFDRDKSRSQVRKDDLIVTIVGASVGQVCRIPDELPDHFVCQSIALIRPAITEMGRYLEFFFNAESEAQQQFKKLMYGQGRPHLSFDGLKQVAVPLPPISEQMEIVRCLNEAVQSIERAMEANEQAISDLEKLESSLHTQAFQGKLVPQIPTESPASISLASLKHHGPIKIRTKMRPKKGEAADVIRELLAHFPEEGLTFSDLLQRSAIDYDSLQAEIFTILSGPKPVIKQVFDKKTQRMRFFRTST